MRKFHALCLITIVSGGLSLAAPPGEVTGLVWNNKEVLEWSPAAGADTYNVYRSYIADLSDDYFGTIMEAELPGTNVVEGVTPVSGWGFFYLVTGASAAGEESTMGSGTLPGGSATPRPNNHPWPGFAVAGRWEGLREWPTVAIHSALLRTGEVLTWQGGNPTPTYIWDPVSDTFQARQAHADIFCGGHSFLPDGRLMTIGGTIFCCPPPLGGVWTGAFDSISLGWQEGPSMSLGRWYPTGLTLGDGRILALSGLTENGETNPTVEVYSGDSGWQQIEGAVNSLPLYPRSHLLSDGRVFVSSPSTASQTLDLVTPSWQFVAFSQYGFRSEGSAVLLPPSEDRIMIVGGRQSADFDPGHDGVNLATKTAEVIDMAQPGPAWSSTGEMLFPRMHANLVILPTGKVLTVGGGYNDFAPTYPSEIYDPGSGTWNVVSAMHTFRLYHSTAVLLPDGRVMAAGSNGNRTAEFYHPGYLFRGTRPVIASAPVMVDYGQAFSVVTADAANIVSVVLVRPGAITHSFNMEQRLVDLAFTASNGSLDVTAPSNPNVAPPGYYMLFLLDGNEVPSEAVFIQVR